MTPESQFEMATEAEPALDEPLLLAFAPLHKRAFGLAIGIVAGLLLFVVTAFQVLVPSEGLSTGLLAQYFQGYSVSWKGAFIGMAWGFGVGFVMGWFVAFVRNLVIATSVFITRTREELRATRDFLDHI